MHIKDNRVSNFGSKEGMNSKVGLFKVEALVNFTTQQCEQQCYQLPSTGNQSGNKCQLKSNSTFSRSVNLAHLICGLLL